MELDDEIKPRVEWDDAILFMETSIDFSALFIKTAKDGQFRVIPSLAFECKYGGYISCWREYSYNVLFCMNNEKLLIYYVT